MNPEIISQISALHSAYCNAANVQLPLLPAYERWYFDAIKSGMTAEDIAMVMVDRQMGQKYGKRYDASTLLRNIVGSAEAIGDVMNEAAALRAKKRKPVFPKGKAEVLRATGRPVEPATQGVRHISEVIAAMRKAVQ